MPDTPDPLTATLAKSRDIADGLQFACRNPDKTPDFTSCGGPAAEQYWSYFTPARIASFLDAVEAVLKEHRKMTLYALSVYAHDNSDDPRVHCGHAYADTENSRHVLDDDDNVICLDKPEADVCESCRDESGEQLDWPCPTVEIITRKLTKGETTP